ncbi:DUF4893 domain-containing protein [Sphingomonas sp.]|uniref:DUF4893 domain-containing protein n=1 Tax=Sphingomonas sp. TaxID=28214 RepID=UPI0025D05D74|nr:DUF4893 domain-containing protein [Sphingomonas sp.]
MKLSGVLAATLLLAGCGGRDIKSASSSPTAADWKRVVTPEDMDRLRNWRVAFVKALDEAKASGSSAKIAREGDLLVPDAGMQDVALVSGRYHCRVIKLGSTQSGVAAFTPYPAFDCLVNDEGEVASFAKIGGSQRPVGLIFDDGGFRKIFLGTMMFGDETRPLEYGRDAARDMAGAFQRIGEKRWRLILPYPRFESVMDVVELVPAT